METRKIQQVGGGTYTVSLPKEWATAADIEPGATVALHSHIDGSLVVQTGVDCEAEPLTLSVDETDTAAIERTLQAAYAAGIDTVELDAPDGITDETHRLVERLTRELTGVAVTESTDRTVRVRSLLDVEEVSMTQSVRQLQFAALSAHRDATAALTSPTGDGHVGATEPDRQTARTAAMVDHYFQRGLDSLAVMDALGLTRPALFVRWVTARELDRIADHARGIAATVDRLDEPVDAALAADIDDLADRSRTLVRQSVGVVLDDPVGGPDDETTAVCGLLDDCDALAADVDALDRRLFEADDADYRLTHVLDGVRRTAESAGTIAEVGLRSALRSQWASTPRVGPAPQL